MFGPALPGSVLLQHDNNRMGDKPFSRARLLRHAAPHGLLGSRYTGKFEKCPLRCRYGTDILGDLARLSLADTEAGAPGLACEPDLAREPDLAAAPEVPFGEVAAMPHKWQARCTKPCLLGFMGMNSASQGSWAAGQSSWRFQARKTGCIMQQECKDTALGPACYHRASPVRQVKHSPSCMASACPSELEVCISCRSKCVFECLACMPCSDALRSWARGRRSSGHHACPRVLQVSRLFSALLQLANNGNVALLRGARPGEPFRLRLLRLARPSLGGFRAPSCLQTQVHLIPWVPVPWRQAIGMVQELLCLLARSGLAGFCARSCLQTQEKI